MEKVAILYGSSTGNTERIANLIAWKIGDHRTTVIDITEISLSHLENFRYLIFGTSTWGIGELQGNWKRFLVKLCQADLTGKTIAMFGLGDCESYPDSFVDGMGIVYEALRNRGCNFIGQVETSGYKYDHSKAVYDGKFIGLPLDEDNEPELTEIRVDNWLDSILVQFK